MSLSDGDPAPDGDVWFRIVTQENHIKRGGVHHGAWGNAIRPPPRGKNRPWARELSGRLRSRAGSLEDIEEHAKAFCERETARGGGAKTFSGVIYARVGDVKQGYRDILTTDVHFTPRNPGDEAHADLTFDKWLPDETKEETERFNLWLSDLLEALHPLNFIIFQRPSLLHGYGGCWTNAFPLFAASSIFCQPRDDAANMRENGVRSIAATCECGHKAIVDVSGMPGTIEMPSLRWRLRWVECGEHPNDVRPKRGILRRG